MTGIIPRKKFAEECGIANKILPVEVSRGRLVINGTRCSKCEGKNMPCRDCSAREYIDLNYRNKDGRYLNLDFYKRYAEHQDIPLVPKVKEKKQPVKEQPAFVKSVVISAPEKIQKTDLINDFGDISETSSHDRLDKAAKYFSIIDKQQSTKLKELQLAKLMGELIPNELATEIVAVIMESAKRALLDNGESLIMIISDRLQAQEHDRAFMRTKLIDTTNKFITETINASQKRIKNESKAIRTENELSEFSDKDS